MESPGTNLNSSQASSLFRFRRIGADIILGAVFLLIAVFYALLMLRDRVSPIGLIALAGLWLVYAILSGRLSVATPMDMPIGVLLMLLPLNLMVSVDWQLSLPKIYGVFLGIALYYLIVNYFRGYSRLPLMILGLVLLAVAVALLGLVSGDWSGDRLFNLSPIYHRLPRLLNLTSGTAYESGVNVNTIGGAMTFFVPLLLSMFWDDGAFARKYLASQKRSRLLNAGYKSAIAMALMLVLMTLFLTQSRGAYFGAAVGVIIFAVLKDRRLGWVMLGLMVITLMVLMVLTNGDLAGLITRLDTDAEAATLPGRLLAWTRTGAQIQDFALTGAGIGTYSMLFEEVYSFNIFPPTAATRLQAHNTFLSVAVDLGIPALILYTALISSAVVAARKTIKYGRSVLRVLLIGLVCGLIGHHVFGIMDTYSLGTKLGVILWIFLGTVSAVLSHRRAFHWRKDLGVLDDSMEYELGIDFNRLKAHLVDLLIGIGLWVLFSLSALTFVNVNIFISLGLALILGIVLGAVLTARFRKNSSRMQRRKP